MLLRHSIASAMMKPRCRSNSICVHGFDPELWAIVSNSLEDEAVRSTTGAMSRRGFATVTSRPVVARFKHATRSDVLVTSTIAGLKVVASFLGNHCNFYADTAALRAARISGNQHVFFDHDVARTIVPYVAAAAPAAAPVAAPAAAPTTAPTSSTDAVGAIDDDDDEYFAGLGNDEEDDLDDEEEDLDDNGQTPPQATTTTKPRVARKPTGPQLRLKYGTELRVLSIQVTWLQSTHGALVLPLSEYNNTPSPSPLTTTTRLSAPVEPRAPAEEKKRPREERLEEGDAGYKPRVATLREWETKVEILSDRLRTRPLLPLLAPHHQSARALPTVVFYCFYSLIL
mmetsp:Transcript_19812/g.61338  ORF Transcript_19812/g.61338 Transcript_19812/m.61338 type:complete len:342 (-) Transcript_19812:15-1040(-)